MSERMWSEWNAAALSRFVDAARRGDLHAILDLPPGDDLRAALDGGLDRDDEHGWERLLALCLADGFFAIDTGGISADYAELRYWRYDDDGYAMQRLNVDLATLHSVDEFGLRDPQSAYECWQAALLDGPYPEGPHEEYTKIEALLDDEMRAHLMPLMAPFQRAAPVQDGGRSPDQTGRTRTSASATPTGARGNGDAGRRFGVIGGTRLDVPSQTGGFVVREVVRFAFFVRRPHRQVAPAAVEAFGRLIELFPPPALSQIATPSGSWRTCDAKGLKTRVRRGLIGKDSPINGSASVWGDQANIPDFGVEYVGLAIDRDVFRDGAAALWFFAAADVVEPYLDRAIGLADEINELLGCSAGYVDLALEGHQARTQELAHRHPGVDISRVSVVARDLTDKMPGVFWRNYLGPDLAAQLGGRATLESLLSSQARMHDADSGGLVVALGTAPTRGTTVHSDDLADRVALARHAHQRGLLHAPHRVHYFYGEDDLSASEAQERWHLRLAR